MRLPEHYFMDTEQFIVLTKESVDMYPSHDEKVKYGSALVAIQGQENDNSHINVCS